MCATKSTILQLCAEIHENSNPQGPSTRVQRAYTRRAKEDKRAVSYSSAVKIPRDSSGISNFRLRASFFRLAFFRLYEICKNIKIQIRIDGLKAAEKVRASMCVM